MDIGVYNLKYPFRKMIGFLLPLFKNSDPNWVSLALIPIGLLTAVVYYFAPGTPWMYLLGAFLIVVRMTVGTLDGLIAVTYNKSSEEGEIINRIAPELADMVLMPAIILASPAYYVVGIWALSVSWGITFFGLIGLTGKRSIQGVGPVGQTDRIAALILLSVLQYLGSLYGWTTDWMLIFLYWVIGGGILTMLIRAYRSLKPRV